MKTQTRFLTILGLLVISISQIIAHYIKLSDFISGTITGIGIGLMIVSFLRSKKVKKSRN